MKSKLLQMYSIIIILVALIISQTSFANPAVDFILDPECPIIIDLKTGVQEVKVQSGNYDKTTFWVTSSNKDCVQIASGKKGGKFKEKIMVKSDNDGEAYIRVKCLCKDDCITDILFEATGHNDLYCEIRCYKNVKAAQICYLPHQSIPGSILDVDFESDIPYFVDGQTTVDFGNRITVNSFDVFSPISATANITVTAGTDVTEYDVYCSNLGINDTCVSFSVYNPAYMVPSITNWGIAILIVLLITITGFMVKRKYWNVSKNT